MLRPLCLQIEDPDQPEIRRLLTASDAYYRTLYPAESNHLYDISALRQPNVTFYVARLSHVACGFGAIVQYDGYAELKRMYVDPPARRQGIGHHLLQALENHARRTGQHVLRLETGIKQNAALALYREHGYREIDPFGRYAADPLSVFLEKRLQPIKGLHTVVKASKARQFERELRPAL